MGAIPANDIYNVCSWHASSDGGEEENDMPCVCDGNYDFPNRQTVWHIDNPIYIQYHHCLILKQQQWWWHQFKAYYYDEVYIQWPVYQVTSSKPANLIYLGGVI